MIEIEKAWTFDAAHMLPNHDGKCRRLHGHTYKVKVSVARALDGDVVPVGSGRPDEGMVIDFKVLSDIWKLHLEPRLDHQYLNDTIGAECGVTTAENIAAWIATKFRNETIGRGIEVTQVDVWETPTGRATWTP